MDPLSIAASCIAIIGLAATVAKTLEDLRTTLRDASADLCSLINEISDLRIVLDAIVSAGMGWEEEKGPPAQDLGMGYMLAQTQKQLEELNGLVRGCLVYQIEEGVGVVRASKFRWMRERRRIKSAQSGIRDKKMDLATLLGAYNLSGIGKLQMSIHQIQIGTEQIQRDNQIHQKLSEQILEKTSISEGKASNNRTVAMSHSTGRSDNQTLDVNLSTRSGLQGNIKEIIDDAELIRVQASFYRKATCKLLCACKCHQRGIISTPAFTKRFIGSLFIGYSGVPLMTPECNENRCRQRAETRVAVSYQFPKWFWSQAFVKAMLALSSVSGPEMVIRVQRTYPYASEIYQYCLDGDVGGLKRLFQNRVVSPYDVDLDGRSLLHNALRGRNPDTACQILITAGADVHQEDQEGISPFNAAWDMVLLSPAGHKKQKAQSNKLIELFPLSDGGLDERQFSRLHKIVLGMLPNSLKEDLEISTSSINEGDNLGRTPLFWAASRGDIEAVSLLLEYGADPKISGNTGPLHAAGGGGHSEILKMLLDKGAHPDSLCTLLTTPLMRAAANNDGNDCVQLLLDYGANINAQDAALNFALLEAAQNCMFENTKVLLKNGANPDMMEMEGWTALASSVFWKERGTTQCIGLLLDAGADYTTLTISGDNLLHNAAQYVGTATLKALIKGKLVKLESAAKNAAGLTPWDLAESRTDVDEIWWEHFRALIKSTEVGNRVVEELIDGINEKKDEMSVGIIELSWDDDEDDDQEDVFEDAVEKL